MQKMCRGNLLGSASASPNARNPQFVHVRLVFSLSNRVPVAIVRHCTGRRERQRRGNQLAHSSLGNASRLCSRDHSEAVTPCQKHVRSFYFSELNSSPQVTEGKSLIDST